MFETVLANPLMIVIAAPLFGAELKKIFPVPLNV
jgi:hypothetical protein